MPFAPLDDRFDDCPKYAELSAAEMGIIACAITYSNRNLSDGRIPKVWPERRFGADGRRLSKRMIELGIWEVRADGDYQVIGFLDHNPSRERVLSKRAEKVAAGKEGGIASARSRRRDPNEAPAQAAASSTTCDPLEAPSEPNATQRTTTQPDDPPNPPAGGVESDFRLPTSETRSWGPEWIAAYERSAEAGLGRPLSFDRRQMHLLEQAIEKFCKDRTRITEWVGKAAREFGKATRLEEAKLWSAHQPKGLLRWLNENRPGYVGPRDVVTPAAVPRQAPLEKPSMTAEATAAAIGDLLKNLGKGGA